jgi:hypothetical protein
VSFGVSLRAMMLARLFVLGSLVTAVGCGDDPIPLQVQFHYTTYCDGGGCSTRDIELDGKNGTALPLYADGSLGIECQVTQAGDTTVATSLRIQDRPISTPQPHNGIKIYNGRLSVGSSMSCPEDGFTLYDDRNEYTGGCAGLSDGNCQILVDEFSGDDGRMFLVIDCQNLVPIAGDTHRSIRMDRADSGLTIQGCDVTKDTR